MKESEKWQQLDDAVGALLVGASTIHDRLNFLESRICTQAPFSLFGLAPPRKNSLKGLNRRAQHSIEPIK